ncbi:MAG: MBL fold metallo-hydrolase [Desulfobacula sp.]|jgi:phosphoribosyl 1,2-cyclic phosphodiesterase|uniref:MBL fold metallo-hydrolase n=1 Tax=Desulfobacula sp. TaxID=2593537 RepID=UPI0039B92A24|nr:MBL fold metallo-hydrolase [Desulfobacula sp.]
MINIKTIASGSSGNCYSINDGDTKIMIECGIPFKQIQEAFSFKLSKVSGCLISHSHKDHCKATKEISRAGINCYMSKKTGEEIGVTGHRIHTFKTKEIFKIGTFKILPFSLQHDVENHGFLLQSNNGDKLCYITDSFYCRYQFSGVKYYLIECNYQADKLEKNIKAGVVPEAIRNRITRSHFEIENVKEFFRANDCSKIRQIHLIHVSGNNGDKELFKAEIQALTGKEVYI